VPTLEALAAVPEVEASDVDPFRFAEPVSDTESPFYDDPRGHVGFAGEVRPLGGNALEIPRDERADAGGIDPAPFVGANRRRRYPSTYPLGVIPDRPGLMARGSRPRRVSCGRVRASRASRRRPQATAYDRKNRALEQDFAL